MPLGAHAGAVRLTAVSASVTPVGPTPHGSSPCPKTGPEPVAETRTGTGGATGLTARLTYGFVTYGFVAYDPVGSGTPVYLSVPLEFL
ncbi:hypothetical protein BX257_7574 [Streptomyces sp. 3212.3]|nr:hypothetical protein BX257_7574 [Streptomyces sp. 3212.3]